MPRIRAFVLPLLLLLVVAPAWAATYWVSPSGVSGRSGADSLSNSTTLAWFNANAIGGDVCRFKSGTYVDPIKPARSGNSGSRIRYYGFPQDPTAVVVTDIMFGYQYGSYSTVRWASCRNGATGLVETAGMEATDDSIVACRITGQTGQFNIGSKRSVLDSLVITGTITGSGQNHFINIAGERSHYTGTIGEWAIGTLDNRFTNSTVTVNVNTTGGSGDVHIVLLSAAAYNRIAGNTFNVTVTNCNGYFFGIEQYEGYYNQIQNNTWNFAVNGTIGGSRGVWCHRDSSSYNRYVGNTVNITGSGTDLSFMLSNGGSFPGTTGHNYYGNNVIRDHNPQTGTGIFWYYDGTRADTIEFNTLMTDAARPCVLVSPGTSVNGSIFRHNTYWTAGATAVDFSAATAVNSPRLVSEIYYCRTANGAGSENVRVPSGVRLDSAGVFFSPGSSTPGRAIAYGGVAGSPGSGGNYGLAGKAVWGTPAFTDSNYASFNSRLTSGSYAANAGLSGGFAGAVPFGSGSSDITPPATITNLAIGPSGPSSLSVQWTAPGDDGNTGTAAQYDLRWSPAAITAGNFASATPVSPQPVPAFAGTAQSYVALGLTGGTTYFFAIRTRDAAGNWSGVSNSVSGTPGSGDTVPPAPVHDLTPGP
jgi:hypothetical protein